MNLVHWKCYGCGEEFFENAAEQDVECPKCFNSASSFDSEEILNMVEEAALSYSAPTPEFPLDDNVLSYVKEPKVEYPYGLCPLCGVPKTAFTSDTLCDDCSWGDVIMDPFDFGGLPN